MHYTAEKIPMKFTTLLLLSSFLSAPAQNAAAPQNATAQGASCTKNTFNSCCNGCGYSFTSNDELKNAVDEFEGDRANANDKYGIMNCWDVSWITDMSYLFYQVVSFNEPLDCWNVSSTINMQGMFAYSTSFNQPLARWDVSSVTDMQAMFALATSFNQPLNSWNTSKVTKMNGMFAFATSFNQLLYLLPDLPFLARELGDGIKRLNSISGLLR